MGFRELDRVAGWHGLKIFTSSMLAFVFRFCFFQVCLYHLFQLSHILVRPLLHVLEGGFFFHMDLVGLVGLYFDG